MIFLLLLMVYVCVEVVMYGIYIILVVVLLQRLMKFSIFSHVILISLFKCTLKI